jgi:predicted DNA-binding protein (MmcQ/YjbR family)
MAKLELSNAGEKRVLDRLRTVALALPGAEEAIKWGHPNFLVGGKIFASFGRDGGRLTIGFKCSPLDQAERVATGRYRVAPYVGRFGWVCFDVVGRVPWREIADGIKRSHQLISAGSKKRT